MRAMVHSVWETAPSYSNGPAPRAVAPRVLVVAGLEAPTHRRREGDGRVLQDVLCGEEVLEQRPEREHRVVVL